jgi:hypothetical protein
MSDKQTTDKRPTQRHAEQHPADKRPTPDERRVAGTVRTPTREEMEQDHADRLETINNPPTPTPTQAEADAMMEGAYEQGATVATEEAARERRERETRDMKPQAGADYKTR